MAIQSEGFSIDRIRLVDDDENARASMVYYIEDMELEHVPVPGPINDITKFVNEFERGRDAAICDHNLKERMGYSDYYGAEVVSRLYQSGSPAILSTRYEQARLFEDIRKYRRYIPVVINPSELSDIDTIVAGLRMCMEEIKGKIRSSRKQYRTLVRVADVDMEMNPHNPFVDVIIPGWDVNQILRLLVRDLPEEIQKKVEPDYRCHAMVNIGAERQEDIFFDNWEPK